MGGFVVLEYTNLVTGLNSKILPLIFVVLIAFLIATAFLNVYDLGISAILICFCIDLEENKPGSYMFSESLARAAGKRGQSRSASSSREKTDKYVASDDEEGGPIKDEDDSGGDDDFI